MDYFFQRVNISAENMSAEIHYFFGQVAVITKNLFIFRVEFKKRALS